METTMRPIRERVYTLLRWSEKYTKTDMVYLTHGGLWLSLGTTATAVSSFVLSIAFANLLPATAYGLYKYIISLGSTLNAFTLSALDVAITQAVSRGYEGTLRKAFLTNLWWSVPISLAAAGGAVYYFAHGNNTFGFSLLIVSIFQPLTVSVNYGAAYLNGKKAFRDLALFYTVDNIFPAALLVTAMLISKSALVIIATYFVANFITTACMYWYVVRRYKPNTQEDHAAITYGKHLSAMNVLAIVAENFDKLLTFHFLGATQLAVYSFALALPSQTKLITKPLSSLIFPKFAARNADEIRRTMAEKTARFFIAAMVLTFGYILIAPFAFKIFYPKYTDAIFLSQLYAISMLAFTATPMGTFISAKRKVRSQYIMNIGASVFQLVSAVIGIVLGGLVGLILARVATRLVGALFSVFFYYTDKHGEDPTGDAAE